MHEMDETFFQSGFSDEDIIALLKLIRSQTDERILEIISEKDDAVVRTGILAGPLAGAGKEFECLRTENGWQITSENEWIS